MMTKFITLTRTNGTDTLINPEQVTAIFVNFGETIVETTSGNQHSVKETVNDILGLIEKYFEAKKSEVNGFTDAIFNPIKDFFTSEETNEAENLNKDKPNA